MNSFRFFFIFPKQKGRVKLMWIPSHLGITGNERADETAKNALAENINDRDLYPPQDLINWMKKTDAKKQIRKVGTGRKHHEVQKGN
jgi:ribonuclease HI